MFFGDRKYALALVDSVRSVRKDGGWRGDVLAVISGNVSVEILRNLRQEDVRNVAVRLSDILLEAIRYPPEFSPGVAACRLNGTDTGGGGVPYARMIPYYHKAMVPFSPFVKKKWDRVLFMDSCMTFHLPKIPLFFTRIRTDGHLLAVPDPWQWSKKGLSQKILFRRCDQAAYRRLIANPKIDVNLPFSYFASGLMLYDTSIIDPGEDAKPGTTLEEIRDVWEQFGTLMMGDQELQSIYWGFLKNVYRMLPLRFFGEAREIPYDFRLGNFRQRDYVVTPGNPSRPVCLLRATNNRTQGKRVQR